MTPFPKKPGLFLKVLAAAVFFSILLQRVSIERAAKAASLECFRRYGTAAENDLERVRAYADFILRHILRYPKNQGCLLRSLVLLAFARNVVPALKLFVGFRSSDGTIAGHAWLEKNGAVWLEPPERTAAYDKLFVYA